jgi:hypothetical protein
VTVADKLSKEPSTDILPGSQFSAVMFLYHHCTDSGKMSEGLECLDRMEAGKKRTNNPNPCNPIDLIIAVRALHHALWNNDPIRAASPLIAIPLNSMARSSSSWHMATALIQSSRADFQGARVSLEAAHQILDPWVERWGTFKKQSEWLDLIEQRINDASVQPLSTPTATAPVT